MNELEQLVHTYFEVETPTALTTVSSFFHQETLSKGDFFLKTSKQCERLSFIRAGMLRIFVDTDGKEVTQWISTPGYFVTDLSSFVFETPARWNIQALTDCEIYTISRKDYKQLGAILPSWHMLEKRFITKCFILLENRIFNHLSLSAEERYVAFFNENKMLFNQVPLQYIASMLGMTPETFSRIRKKLAE